LHQRPDRPLLATANRGLQILLFSEDDLGAVVCNGREKRKFVVLRQSVSLTGAIRRLPEKTRGRRHIRGKYHAMAVCCPYRICRIAAIVRERTQIVMIEVPDLDL